MPILLVKVCAPRTATLSRQVASLLLDLTQRILGKSPALTSIAIDHVDPQDWYVGGRPLSEQGLNSVYFDIKITDETNSKAEKAQYISEAFAAFAQLLGDVHEESYIYVQDVRATAYGFGGRTQEYRYHHA